MKKMKMIFMTISTFISISALAEVSLDCQMNEVAIQGPYRETIMHKQSNGSSEPAIFGQQNIASVYLKGNRMISLRSGKIFEVEVRAYQLNHDLYTVEVLEKNLDYGQPSVLAASEETKVNWKNPEVQFNSIFSESTGAYRININCGLNLVNE